MRADILLENINLIKRKQPWKIYMEIFHHVEEKAISIKNIYNLSVFLPLLTLLTFITRNILAEITWHFVHIEIDRNFDNCTRHWNDLRKKNLLNFSLGRLVKQRGMKKSSQNGRYEVKIKALVFHAKIVHSKVCKYSLLLHWKFLFRSSLFGPFVADLLQRRGKKWRLPRLYSRTSR